jgi:hypothetical protein
MLPGTAPPYVADGLATCRATVVPEGMVYELRAAADAGAYWEPVALACYDRSVADRLHGQAVVDELHGRLVLTYQDQRLLRAAVPVAATIGVLVGAAIGVGAAEIAR